ncbi:class D beta-lactamase [Delftia sp. PE138]|uniref:class D beta-lactamase n=1 Tax=Delftia sp. PE138 TaxID=1812483 RepID=UPI001BB099B4|nr:class D beta-lactamase [Delftia sp. PE138]MBS3724407.1 Beta-lactamase OXA-18 [Delftia sp. PE138]
MHRFPGTAATAVAAFFWVSVPAPVVAHELCTLVADADTGQSLVHSGPACAERVTPASTFKIAISLMGYDAGILQDESRPAWPYQPEYPDWGGDAWRRDITPQAWMKDSVFWYSQQVVMRLGQQRFDAYVKAFRYGNEDVSAVPVADPGHNGVWVVSSLRISAAEQVAFMRRIVRRELSVSSQAFDMTARITRHPVPVDGWTVHGKTGTGSPGSDNRYDASRAYGWYVGWATKDQRRLVFATLIQDEQAQKPNAGLRARDALLQRLPAVDR